MGMRRTTTQPIYKRSGEQLRRQWRRGIAQRTDASPLFDEDFDFDEDDGFGVDEDRV